MHELIAAVDAHATAAEAARGVDQPRHQQPVGFQQMLGIGGIPAGQGVVGGDGIAHLLDVAGRTDHPLTIEQGAHLLQAEAVLLNRQGGLDRVDAVLPPQAGRWQSVLTGAPAAEGFGDGGDAVEQLWGEGEGWGVGGVWVHQPGTTTRGGRLS